jgi:4-amino-4-deoxy-L-arabinose transferase-like glycosyltransferase
MHRVSPTHSSNDRHQAYTRTSTATGQDLPRRPALILLAAVFIAVWLGNLEYHKLFRPDEGRYAEIAREMAVTGDWITPRLNGIKYFEKPPLQYWATASAYKIFGEHHWTSRLWPALTGLLGIALVSLAGRSLFGPTAGFYAALVLASSAGYIGAGHMNTLDMGLTFFMTATALAFLLAQRESAGPVTRRRWMLAAWACAALAVLSKGLIGVVLPAAAIAIYALLQRDFGLLRRLQWTAGIMIFLVIAAPWFVLVQHANPEFANFFFIHEHFERFVTESHRRVQPWWFFIPMLAVGLLPWLTLLPQALIRGWRIQQPPPVFQPARFLLIWTIFIFVFFSASGSKLPSYILPILPALALLIGLTLAETGTRQLMWHAVPLLLAGVAVVALSPQVVVLAKEPVPVALYEDYVPWIAAAGVAMVIGSSCALFFCRLGNRGAALLGMGFGGLLAIQMVLTGHEALSPAYSAYYIARDIKPHLAGNMPFFSVRTYDQTLPFYIKRTVKLVAFQDELAYGLEQEPRLWLPDIPSFERAWRGERSALAIMEPQTYAELEKSGLPMQIVARDLRRVVVKRPDAAR